jgi:hypothetical protein
LKTDQNGKFEWNKTFGGEYSNRGYSVQVTSDKGFIFTGVYSYNQMSGPADDDVWVLKTDKDGTVEWERSIGGNTINSGHSIIETSTGDFILTGENWFFDPVTHKLYILKLDKFGNKLWDKSYDQTKWGSSIAETTDGGFVVSGGVYLGSGVIIMKIDKDGNKKWLKTYDCKFSGTIEQTSDGGFVMAGTTDPPGTVEYDLSLVKTNSIGDIITETCYFRSENILPTRFSSNFNEFSVKAYIPEGANVTILFSNDNRSWYDSTQTTHLPDIISNGPNSFDLFTYNWKGNYFYYKIMFKLETYEIPEISEIKLSYFEPINTDGDYQPDITDSDDDNDGYSDEKEIMLGTNPKDKTDAPLNSDEDYQPDGDSSNSETWMDTDDDNDRFDDFYELALGTDPKDQNDKPEDTDGDRIPDGNYKNSEDWMDYDDDDDDMPDSWELIFHLDPKNASDADLDIDNDDIPNYIEYFEDSNPLDPDSPNPSNKKPNEPDDSIDYSFMRYALIVIVILFIVVIFLLNRIAKKEKKISAKRSTQEKKTFSSTQRHYRQEYPQSTPPPLHHRYPPSHHGYPPPYNRQQPHSYPSPPAYGNSRCRRCGAPFIEVDQTRCRYCGLPR